MRCIGPMIWTRYVRITLTDASVYRSGAVSPELLMWR